MQTIFVVDDNNVNLLVAEEALSDFYNVYTMADASIMFTFLNKIMPDLILLDIMMPDIDGFEALKRLRADTRYMEIPVIFLTGQSDAETESRGRALGALDFISKPFLADVLLERVRAHLGQG